MTETAPSVYQKLAERFRPEDHKTKTISGTGLTYVDGETVISRLNEVLGFDGWSFEVKDVNVLENEVWASGRLTVYSGDRVIVREQAGGQIINRKRDTPFRAAIPAEGDRPEQPEIPFKRGEVIELSNDIKGAVTDCLKKCATLVGVGLYLYDPAERREVEQEMREAKRAPSKPAPLAAGTPAADRGTPASRSAGTPSVSGAQPTSGSSTATSAPTGDHGSVRDAAILTGADPKPGNAFICAGCESVVTNTVTILKKKEGPKVTVEVKDFGPVCEARLGAIYCGPCYDERYWKVKAA